MSKKVTEFDRYDRMKKMERESEAQRRKAIEFASEPKKSRKTGKSSMDTGRKGWMREYDPMEEEFQS